MHELPILPYAFDAIEPHIDARTMEIHHGKHHQAYVDNLNKALAPHADLAAKPLEDLLRGIEAVPDSIRTAVRNHGGGHSNHSLFWTAMAPGAGGEPGGSLGEALTKEFGSFSAFKEKITNAAAGQFGSGWGWLVLNSGRLEAFGKPNQDSPLMEGKVPLLGVDVWEHAYYLKYQNRRADYICAWWNTVNWKEVEARFLKARG
jgi:Fe-Mn family superoxide dismutase